VSYSVRNTKILRVKYSADLWSVYPYLTPSVIVCTIIHSINLYYNHIFGAKYILFCIPVQNLSHTSVVQVLSVVP
jgi:hypothetical protein